MLVQQDNNSPTTPRYARLHTLEGAEKGVNAGLPVLVPCRLLLETCCCYALMACGKWCTTSRLPPS